MLSDGLAAADPALGLWIKDAEILHLVSPRGGAAMTPPKLLLSLLPLNAGLRVRIAGIGRIGRRPGVMIAGLATNLAIPPVLLAVMMPALRA